MLHMLSKIIPWDEQNPVTKVYSPWIVAINVLRCELVRNSQRYIPCHVPKANLPAEIGTETLVPVNTDLICAGYTQLQPNQKSEGYNAINRQRYKGLGEVPCHHCLRRCGGSRLQGRVYRMHRSCLCGHLNPSSCCQKTVIGIGVYSLRVNPADVCCMNKCSNPTLYFLISGTFFTTSS